MISFKKISSVAVPFFKIATYGTITSPSSKVKSAVVAGAARVPAPAISLTTN